MKLGWIQYVKLLFGGKPVLEEAIQQGYNVRAEYEKSSWSKPSFWLSVLVGLGAIIAQLGHAVPAPYGQIAATLSGVFYAISKGLEKRDDPLGGAKPQVCTTEFWLNLAHALAQAVGAAQGVLDPQTAAILASISAGAISAADSLAKSGAQLPAHSDATPETDTAVSGAK